MRFLPSKFIPGDRKHRDRAPLGDQNPMADERGHSPFETQA